MDCVTGPLETVRPSSPLGTNRGPFVTAGLTMMGHPGAAEPDGPPNVREYK
jgi:hypothetical protein